MQRHLVDEVCAVYGMTLPDFARHIDFPKSTLQTWKDTKCSKCGEIMLTVLIENHKLREKDEAMKTLISLYTKKD